MTKTEAPVTLTGGAGFNYEDYVAGRFLVDMLTGLSPFGPDSEPLPRLTGKSVTPVDYLTI